MIMKNTIQSIKENYRSMLVVLVTGLFLGWLFFHPSKEEKAQINQAEVVDGHDHPSETPSVWTCSMHPQIRQDKPGKCPICAMDLIPVTSLESSSSGADPNEIMMSESAAKLAEIQTMTVGPGAPQRVVSLQGKVQADERNMAEITARFGGRIEKLFVNFTGQQVNKGEKLATIYSPDLVSAQQELIEAMVLRETRPSLYKAARTKLKLWDLSDEQIESIEQGGEPMLYFDIHSPITGTIMERHVAQGDYVQEGSSLFQVTDLSGVWVVFDAYESDLPWISKGDLIELTFQSLPGKSYEGRVTYIDPYIDPGTRVAGVRIELPNGSGLLKPEMFARGKLHSRMAAGANQLLIPKSSILWTGKRAVVYVKVPGRSSPTFLYREITLGPEAGDFYVVAEGLTSGEEIAVNGVFKIDASAQLEGKTSMMNPQGGRVSTGHDHGSMAMEPAGDAQKDPTRVNDEFKAQLQRVYDAYIPMKDAFVLSDAGEVGRLAKKLGENLDRVDMGLLKGEAHMKWMKQVESLKGSVDRIAGTGEIESQRREFAAFNSTFYNTVKVFGLSRGTVYYQYCPMANGDTGAFWLSTFKEIKNPYFGDAMLGCGETRETLEF